MLRKGNVAYYEEKIGISYGSMYVSREFNGLWGR